jgi:P-type Mg2+ transporter
MLRKILARLNNHHKSPVQKDVAAGMSDKLLDFARNDVDSALQNLHTSIEGLTASQSKTRLEKSGLNEIAKEKTPKWYVQLFKTFQNPLVILLIILAMVSGFTGDAKAATIIIIMVIFSVLLRFSQEFRSSQAAAKLQAMVSNTATIGRKDLRKDISPEILQGFGITLHPQDNLQEEIPIKFIVPGDIVHLSAGDMIPADLRLIAARDLFASQGMLTGESLPIEKHVDLPAEQRQSENPLELVNLCFMGTNIISGTGTAVVGFPRSKCSRATGQNQL